MTAPASTQRLLGSQPRLGVIGAGRLGTTLAQALSRHGQRVVCVASQRPESAAQLAAAIPGCHAASLEALCEQARVILLATPDDAVRALATTLPLRAGQALVHCSGALDLTVLEPALTRGALAGCMHPIQTFPTRFDHPSRFTGITIGIEASEPQLHAWLLDTAAALGAATLELSGVDRARYHAAAVLASNYVIALHQAAGECFELAGLSREQARTALAPLTLRAAEAIAERPLAQALTGPIARGDAGTVQRHLTAIAIDPELQALYGALAARLLALSLPLSPQVRAQLEAALQAAVTAQPVR